MKAFKKNLRLIAIVVIIAGVFIIDLQLPRGYFIGELYLVTFIFAYQLLEKKQFYLLSVICSALVIIDLILSKPGIPFEISLMNRSVLIIFFFVISAGISEMKKKTNELYQNRKDLANALCDLQEKESKLKAVIKNSPDAIWSIDKNYKFTLANSQTIHRVKSYFSKDLKLGESALWEMVSESYPKKWKPWYDRCLNGESFIVEEEVEIKPGKILYREYSLNPIHENEEITGAVCFSRDISERKKYEHQIKQDNILLNGVLNSSTDGTSVFKAIRDGNGKIIDFEWLMINRAGAKVIGKSINEIIGKRLLDILPGTKQEGLFDLYVDIVENDKMRDHEHYYKHEGIDSWFREIALKYEDGFIVSFQDITKRKNAELELRKLLSQLEEIVELRTKELKEANDKLKLYMEEVEDLYENAPCGYHSLDENGVFKRINSTELKWLGYDKEELIDKKKVTDIMTDASNAEFNKHFPEFKKKGALHNHEFEFITKDGTVIPALLSASALLDETGKFIRSRSTLLDITERKKAETEIQELNKDLQKKQILLESINKELEAFSYSVSHDLRAPLRHIHGFIELLSDSAKDKLGEKDLHYLDVVSSSAKEMGILIDDLLEFSRMGRAEMQLNKVDLNPLVGKEIERLKEKYKGKQINFDISPLPEIYGDIAMLQSVFTNLLSNAAKYSAKRNEIRIEVGYDTNDNEYIFYVKDNGAGFDMKYSDKLFGVFQRLHSSKDFEGTGIGLANVRRIISRHGGKTWADGEIDKGATFYFSIPI